LISALLFGLPLQAMALDVSQPPAKGEGVFGDKSSQPESNAGITLKLTYKPSGKAKTESQPVVVLPFADKRAKTANIGYRTAAFGVDMGKVYADQSVTNFVHDAFVKELAAKGYGESTSDNTPQISGELHSFWVQTNTTPLYWEIEATVWMTLATSCPSSAAPAKSKSYEVTKKTTTFVWPSESLMEKLFQKVMAELMKQTVGDSAKTLAAYSANSH